MMTKVLQTYPQPIAYAYGNVYRAQTRSQPEHLDQILRCAEVTARYLSAMAIASFAARDDQTVSPPPAFAEFRGNLSFGHFLSAVQAVSKLTIRHPLHPHFSQSFLGKKSPAKDKLEKFLELRNKVGHDLKGLSETSAMLILNTENPRETLEEILEGIQPLCLLPLFLVDTQRPIRRVIHAVRLILMGEQSEPMPKQVAVSEAFMEDKRLYVGCEQGALPLHPMLVWDLERDRAAQGIYVIHKIVPEQLTYKSLTAFSQPTAPPIPTDMLQLLEGHLRPIERILLHDGRSFLQEWTEQRELILSGKANVSRTVEWIELDRDILRWYSGILKVRVKPENLDEQKITVDWNSPPDVIRQILLDGRGEVTADEFRQLVLLFGTTQKLRQLIGRNLLDIRSRQSAETRWNERQELADNILVALRKAVEFIGRNNPLIEGLSVNYLQTSTGSADYIAVREALINLLIHQDYSDQRTVAQIELEPDRTTMVNAGASLVSEEELVNGGTSTARNPLIARALKLIGFAELGGSGLREVSRVWRNAQRRPPVVQSDEQNNRFRIELDSRPIKAIADSFWKQRLGVTVMPEEAKILGLLGSFPEGLRIADICSGTGYLLKDTQVMCQRLGLQGLLDCKAEVYRLKPHLQDFAREVP